MQVKLRLYYLNTKTRKLLNILIIISVVKKLSNKVKFDILGSFDDLPWDTHLTNLEKNTQL